jgi:ribosome-associated protein
MPEKSYPHIKNKTAVAAIEGLLSKKGKRIVVMNMEKIENSISAYFIICHGTSRPHITALADSVVDEVKSETGFNPWNKEGFENAEWILIDYADVVIHIFQETSRAHYKLEELWADAEIQQIESED